MKRIALALILLLPVAFASAGTLCGAQATGKRYLEGDTWTAKTPGQYVDDTGYWQYCPSWVAPDGGDPKTPEPQPPCPGREGAEVWYGADNVSECDSRPKDQTTSLATKLHFALHKDTQMIYDDLGPTRGTQKWQCLAGNWKLLWASCETIKQAPAVLKPPRKLLKLK